MNTVKVLILATAPEKINPSQRFRFEHFLNASNKYGLEFTLAPFFSDKTWKILHKEKHYLQKTIGILSGFVRRTKMLGSIRKFDMVYIHREASPIGPPIFEWIINKVLRKPIVYDFDDAIWINTASQANPFIAVLKFGSKVSFICKIAKSVSVGNEYLAAFAMRYSKDVRVIPTLVDTEKHHNQLKNQSSSPITIGWTGTYTNFHNLTIVEPVLRHLQKNFQIRIKLIADKNPNLKNIEYDFQKWNYSSEIEDLLDIHIGLMPLIDSEFERGKCAFKAIQYMSLGIPAVISPVGANIKLIKDGENGYLVSSETEWLSKLENLINDPILRTKMGEKARKTIIDQYSVKAYESEFFNLFSV